jgi:WD40 repeat protein
MISATFRRWRALRRRSRAACLLGAAMVVLVGVGFAGRPKGDTWLTRAVLQAHECALPLAFSPDRRTFLTTGRGGIISWDAASGREGKTWTIGSNGSPQAWTFSPDGKTFAAALLSYPGPLSIDLFDTTTGRTRATLGTPRQTIMHLAFADDGRTLRAFLGDEPLMKACLTWNPSCGSDLNEVVTIDVATGRQVSTRPLTAPTHAAVTAISPDGRTLVIADRITPIQLWDLDADKTLGTLVNPATTNNVVGSGLGFSEDGRTLAIGRLDGSIEFWDVSTRRLLKTFPGPSGDFVFTTIRFSPEGRTLAVTGYLWGRKSPLTNIQDEIRHRLGMRPQYNAEAFVLDVASGRRLARAADSTRPYFSPDGRTLATQEPDGSTRLRVIPDP